MNFDFREIGLWRTDWHARADAPRQPYVSGDIPSRIELGSDPDLVLGLRNLEDWSHLWIVYVFHGNLDRGWRPLVKPPRSRVGKRGVFSTRSPHRPNAIGLSLVALDRVEGGVVHVRGADVLDGTPVLDIKPYLPFAESIPDAATGFIGKDPDPPHEVVFEPRARTQLDFLAERGETNLEHSVAERLALGPEPHAYRRIQRVDGRLRLALHAWRVFFRAEGRTIVVEEVATGYKPSELASGDWPEVALHRDFVGAFASAR